MEENGGVSGIKLANWGTERWVKRGVGIIEFIIISIT